MMVLTRRPSDGRLLALVYYDRAPALLDVETDNPAAAASTFAFVRNGRAPAISEWAVIPWSDAIAERRVITYNQVVRPNMDFIRYLRDLAREEAARYERIPSRRRRHDRA